MKTISLKIPESLDSQIVALAERTKKNKSELIREILEDYLVSKQISEKLSAISDIVGSIDGPEDLSYNKDYLKKLGMK